MEQGCFGIKLSLDKDQMVSKSPQVFKFVGENRRLCKRICVDEKESCVPARGCLIGEGDGIFSEPAKRRIVHIWRQ